MHLCGLLQIHHIIPLQHATHPTVTKLRFDVHHDSNLIFMTTQLGYNRLNVPNRLIHDGGHLKYNIYVGERLTEIQKQEEMQNFIKELNQKLRTRNSDIPWS